MKRLFFILILCGTVHAQSLPTQRVEIGINAAADRDRGYRATAFGFVARGIFKFGLLAIDASAEYVVHAPKTVGGQNGRTISTDVLVRHYILPNLYAVGGIDVSKLSTVLVDATAASAATGAGVEFSNVRIQALYEPPDFTSGQTLSHYRADFEYIKRLSKKHYLSFRWQGRISRFDRGNTPGTLTGERVEFVVSVGRFF